MELSYQDKIKVARAALRPYQVGVVEHMKRDKRHLNYLDMGMGKSLTTLLSVVELEAFPLVILCSKSAMGVMQQELESWFGLSAVIYSGKPKDRDQAWYDFVVEGHKVIIANYSMAEELSARFGIIKLDKLQKESHRGRLVAKSKPTPGTTTKWKLGALVCDEIQRAGLFNHKTKTHGVVKRLAKEADVCYLLTGTPYRRGVVDFFGPLNIIRPDKFDSYWKYVAKYCRTIETPFGKQIERVPGDLMGFRKMIRQYASILRKEEHLKELPGKIRQAIPITMDAEQSKVYNELVEELMSITDSGDLILTPSQLTLGIRLRQLLVCPQVLGLKTRGAALDTLVEMAEDFVKDDKPFVIFTPFRKAVPYIREAILGEYPELGKVTVIEGELTPEEFTSRWTGFQNAKGKGVMICVIKSGASFHATRASTAFFLGCEYDFNENTQAEDRLYRMGQKEMVTCYYLMHKGTIEDSIFRILNEKVYTSDLVLSPSEVLRDILEKNKRK